MTAIIPAPPARPGRPATVILGRYTTAGGDRVLLARRKAGATFITDEPVKRGRGAVYPVETFDVDAPDQVEALVNDYLSEANRLGDSPMASTVIDRPALTELMAA